MGKDAREGNPGPQLTSIAVQLPFKTGQLLKHLAHHGWLSHTQAVQRAHCELASHPPMSSRRKEDACQVDMSHERELLPILVMHAGNRGPTLGGRWLDSRLLPFRGYPRSYSSWLAID